MPTSVLSNPAVRCALVCVGSELLRGKLNTHASTLGRRLPAIGLELTSETTVGDELGDLVRAIRTALQYHDLVIVTGGLGPTFDDLTREGAAEATGRGLQISQALIRDIQAKFKRAHYRMPPTNNRQAYLLEGAEVIPNANGTAPGQWLSLGTKASAQVLILLPGPPRELHPMLEATVLPRLSKVFRVWPQAETHLHFVGVAESIVDAKIRPLIEKEARQTTDRIRFTILAHLGLVDLDIFVSSRTQERATRTAAKIAQRVVRCFPHAFYGADEAYPLEKVVGDRFRAKKYSLAIAESCTGGLLAARLTEIAGSSEYFLESDVTYANQAKIHALGVPESTLKHYGAVSKETASAMAEGIRKRSGANIGLSITGIAGPGGGTKQKPVGLVYLALATAQKTLVYELHLHGTRDAIRQRAVLAALDALRRI